MISVPNPFCFGCFRSATPCSRQTNRRCVSLSRRSLRHLIAMWPFSTESAPRSEEHTSELQSLMRISYAVFCLKKKNTKTYTTTKQTNLNDTNHTHQNAKLKKTY